jgi:hypothetical protein
MRREQTRRRGPLRRVDRALAKRELGFAASAARVAGVVRLGVFSTAAGRTDLGRCRGEGPIIEPSDAAFSQKSSFDQARIREPGSANSAGKSLNLSLQWGEDMSTNISVGVDVKGSGTVRVGDTRPVGRS